MASGSSVEIFLAKIGLQTYRTRFESQGYETVFDLCLIEEEDLNLLNIRDSIDRAKILEAGKYIFFLSEICRLGRMSVLIKIYGTLQIHFLYGDRSIIRANDLRQRYNLVYPKV